MDRMEWRLTLRGDVFTHGDRLLACRRVDGGVPDLDFAKAVVVDHSDASVLNHLLEALAILFVADTQDGMPTMMLLFLLLQSLHQDLVGRAAHRIAFAPVQMVDPSAGHAAEPATGLDEDDLGPLFLRSQGCHDAAGRAAIDTNVGLVDDFFLSLNLMQSE